LDNGNRWSGPGQWKHGDGGVSGKRDENVLPTPFGTLAIAKNLERFNATENIATGSV
jgi:hypothetical protein